MIQRLHYLIRRSALCHNLFERAALITLFPYDDIYKRTIRIVYTCLIENRKCMAGEHLSIDRMDTTIDRHPGSCLSYHLIGDIRTAQPFSIRSQKIFQIAHSGFPIDRYLSMDITHHQGAILPVKNIYQFFHLLSPQLRNKL